jgi:ubiquinone/menaquinone biosynthesis C-methylase UbiE
MSSTETFQQISVETAEIYESRFVPRLFAELAPHLVEAGGVAAGHRVLDVACGTGIVARTAADRVGERGSVIGLDLNEAMLVVARRLRPDLEWRQGDAAQLPFPDASFDIVLCQSALMFFPDPAQALREMARVVTADGTVAIQVFSALDRQAGFLPFAEAVARHAGSDAVNLISTYFVHGDPDAFTRLCESAGLKVTGIKSRTITARFDSVDEYVTTEVESTPLVSRISEEIYRRIRKDAAAGLAPFCTDADELALPFEASLVTARSQ